MQKLSQILVPIVQILSAAVTLALWYVLGLISSDSYQAIPIKIFAIAGVLSLPLTLGLPYLLPNEFRDTPESKWGGRGPWSPLITVTTTVSTAGAMLGLALAAVGIAITGAPGAGLLVIAACLAAASFIALSILSAQTARLSNSTPRMAGSTLGNLSIPAVWVVLAWLRVPTDLDVLIYSFIALLGVICLGVVERKRLMSVGRGFSSLKPQVIKAALLLVPHLLLFSILAQGIRLAATVFNWSALLVESHRLMLLVTIGTTLIGAFHAVLTVRVQSAGENSVLRRAHENSRYYGMMGIVAGILSLVVLMVPFLSDIAGIGSIGIFASGAMAVVLPSYVAYYMLSGIVLRSGASWLLLISSSTTVFVYYVASAVVGDQGLARVAVAYGLSTMLLPALICVGGFVLLPKLRPLIRVSLRWVLTAYLAPAVVLLAGVVYQM